MAVKIDEKMYDTFTNNGYTEDDIQNTVTHYRNQGMSDNDIFSNMNKKYMQLSQSKDVLPEVPNKTPEQWEQQRQQMEGEAPEVSQLANPLETASMLALPELKIAKEATLLGRVANRAITGGMWGGVQSLIEKAKGENPNVLGNIGSMALGNVALAPVAKMGGEFISKLLPNAERKIPIDLEEFNKLPEQTKVAYKPVTNVAPAEKTVEGSIAQEALPQPVASEMVQPQAPQPQVKQLPPLNDNYLKDLSQYTQTLHREMSPAQAMKFIGNINTDMTPEQLYFSNKPELALGQGANKGILVELESKGIQGQVSKDKPLWEPQYQQGNAEFVSKLTPQSVYRQNVKSITIKPDAKFTTIESRVIKNSLKDWTKVVNEDGSITFIKPQVNAPEMVQPTTPQPTAPVPEMVQPLNKQALQKDLNVELRALRNSIELPEVTKGTYIKGRYKNRFFTKNITDDLTRDIIDADNALLEVTKEIKNNPANASQNMDILENKLTDKVGKLPNEAQQKYYDKFYKDMDIAGQHAELSKKALTPEAFGYKEVQQQVPVPQGQMKTRGGIKTIGKGFGEDVANQVTDRTYETRGLARNEAEFANLTPEQQMDLVKTDDISDLAIRAKQKNLENQINAGAISEYDINKFARQGTEQAQAFQARDNMHTPVGALTATQSVIRKATPKRINDIIDNADNIVNAVTTARTSVAKVDNLNNTLKGTVKNERKYLIDKILKLDAEGKLNADNVIKLVNKKYNIPEITKNDLTKIQELTTNISSAKTERESEVAKGLLRKFMVDKVPKTLRNKVNTYRYINMLLSPKSRTKDFVFTAAFQGEQAIDEVFAQLPALASRVFKGINTRSGLHPKAWVGGLKKGFTEGAQDVKLGIETGRAGEGTRFDLPRGQQFVYTPLKEIGVEPNVIKKIAMVGENVLSKLEKALNYTIRVPDRMFYEAKYASSIADQLKAANVKEPTSEMIEQAVKEAKDAVYQGDTWASRVSLGARDLLNKLPTGPLKVGDVEMPFIQTVANITEEGFKNVGGLPVGLTKWAAGKTPAELRDAELLIGKGLKSLGYLGVGGAIAGGAIKSNIGDLSTAGKYENSVTGMQPQSVVIGNKAFSLANAPNVTIPIGIYRSLLEQGTPQERAARAAMTAMAAIGDMPAFQTLGDLSKGVGQIAGDLAQEDLQGAQESAVQMGNQQIANVIGQHIPLTGFMGNIRNIVDPYSREQYTQDLGQYISNKTINRIPFASKSLPMRYGITGEPVMMTNIKNPVARAAGELLDPFSTRNYTPNPTIDTMTNLTKQAEGIKGNKAFNIKKAKRSININGERIKLNPKQYSEYQKDYGKINYYLRQKALNSQDFKNMDYYEKIDYMKDLNSSIDQAVKSVLFGHNPKKQARYTQDILDNYDTFTK